MHQAGPLLEGAGTVPGLEAVEILQVGVADHCVGGAVPRPRAHPSGRQHGIELLAVAAQLLFGMAVTGDIDAGTQVAGEAAVGIGIGGTPVQHPAVDAVVPP